MEEDKYPDPPISLTELIAAARHHNCIIVTVEAARALTDMIDTAVLVLNDKSLFGLENVSRALKFKLNEFK